MKLAIATTAVLGLFATTLLARQETPTYSVMVHVFEVNADGTTTNLIGPNHMRTAAGNTALVSRDDEKFSTKLMLVPTDLGSNRVVWHVQEFVVRAGQTTTSTFDVLVGTGITGPTVAARDANGRFLLGPSGMPIYATFEIAAASKSGD